MICCYYVEAKAKPQAVPLAHKSSKQSQDVYFLKSEMLITIQYSAATT